MKGKKVKQNAKKKHVSVSTVTKTVTRRKDTYIMTRE